MDQACDFCHRECFEERIYHETNTFYWILGRSPIRPGHTLVIPKRHLARFEELMPEEINELLKEAQQWIPKLLETYKAVGYNMAVNVSKAAGQAVPHLHFHIVPRSNNEGGKLDSVRKIFYRNEPEHERTRLTAEATIQQIKKLQSV